VGAVRPTLGDDETDSVVGGHPGFSSRWTEAVGEQRHSVLIVRPPPPFHKLSGIVSRPFELLGHSDCAGKALLPGPFSYRAPELNCQRAERAAAGYATSSPASRNRSASKQAATRHAERQVELAS
jgi:hypothetical protein